MKKGEGEKGERKSRGGGEGMVRRRGAHENGRKDSWRARDLEQDR
jgi:hypothetical protein